MHISKIDNGQVFQRNNKNCANIAIQVSNTQSGAIHITVSCKGKAVRGLKNITFKKSSADTQDIKLKNIPCGGPYTVTIQNAKQQKQIKNIFIGDLWVMAGQSNMQGCGYLDKALKAHPHVQMFSMRDQWQRAKEPINCCPISLDAAHRGQDKFRSNEEAQARIKNEVKGTGPAMAFANYICKHFNVPIGIIPCAKGGSSIAEWDPRLKHRGGASLYGACIRRIQACGGKIAGVIWSQGCSDTNRKDGKHYTKRMQALVAALRSDCKQQMPWIITQINGFYDSSRWGLDAFGWTEIRHQQAALPKHIKKLACVSTVDLDLDDGIHLSSAAQHRTGVRMAKVAAYLAGYDKQQRFQSPYIDHVSAKRGNAKASPQNNCNYAVRIKGLNGSLQSDGSKVLGFSLRDKKGNKCMSIYKAWIDGDDVILQTELNEQEKKRYQLYYGFGTTPLCNLSDSEDMAVMAAGPFELT